MSDLHVYANDCEWVVAESLDDAWVVWSETVGERRSDYEDSDPLVELPDTELLSMWADDEGNVVEQGEPGTKVQERPCAEWARINGRGYLGSTEG